MRSVSEQETNIVPWDNEFWLAWRVRVHVLLLIVKLSCTVYLCLQDISFYMVLQSIKASWPSWFDILLYLMWQPSSVLNITHAPCNLTYYCSLERPTLLARLKSLFYFWELRHLKFQPYDPPNEVFQSWLHQRFIIKSQFFFCPLPLGKRVL